MRMVIKRFMPLKIFIEYRIINKSYKYIFIMLNSRWRSNFIKD